MNHAGHIFHDVAVRIVYSIHERKNLLCDLVNYSRNLVKLVQFGGQPTFFLIGGVGIAQPREYIIALFFPFFKNMLQLANAPSFLFCL